MLTPDQSERKNAHVTTATFTKWKGSISTRELNCIIKYKLKWVKKMKRTKFQVLNFNFRFKTITALKTNQPSFRKLVWIKAIVEPRTRCQSETMRSVWTKAPRLHEWSSVGGRDRRRK